MQVGFFPANYCELPDSSEKPKPGRDASVNQSRFNAINQKVVSPMIANLQASNTLKMKYILLTLCSMFKEAMRAACR